MDTILIVDDEKNYPLILSAVLQEEGFEALTANSALSAIEIITQSDVDLVLTDMKMPGWTALNCLRRLRKKTPNCP